MSGMFDEDETGERCRSKSWFKDPDGWSVHVCDQQLGHNGPHACGDGYEWITPQYPPRPSKANLQKAMRELIGQEFGGGEVPMKGKNKT